MIALRDLQHRFARDLLGGAPAIEALIEDGPRAPRETGAGVYRHAYGARLVEALGNDFPVTAALMGPAGFGAAARAYVADHPSRHPSIRWLGRAFAADLDDRGEAVAADMAAFEWALGLAFDAPASDTVAVERLAALAPEAWDRLHPRFQPGFDVVPVRHAVHDAWARFQAGEAPAPAPLPDTIGLLAWRAGLDVRYRVAADGEVRLIAALRAGHGFGAAVGESAVEPARAVELLAGWCLSGIVSALDDNDEK